MDMQDPKIRIKCPDKLLFILYVLVYPISLGLLVFAGWFLYRTLYLFEFKRNGMEVILAWSFILGSITGIWGYLKISRIAIMIDEDTRIYGFPLPTWVAERAFPKTGHWMDFHFPILITLLNVLINGLIFVSLTVSGLFFLARMLSPIVQGWILFLIFAAICWRVERYIAEGKHHFESLSPLSLCLITPWVVLFAVAMFFAFRIDGWQAVDVLLQAYFTVFAMFMINITRHAIQNRKKTDLKYKSVSWDL